MAKKRNKHRKAKASPAERSLGPTPEREAKNPTQSAGMARRIIPPIDTLRQKGKLTPAQHEALTYYRDQANLAERSPSRDSCDFSVRGGEGHGPGVAIVSAQIESYEMEVKLGPLIKIAQAVVRDDMTLAQWCIREYGGTERIDGNVMRIIPVRKHTNMKRAEGDLVRAANRLLRKA